MSARRKAVREQRCPVKIGSHEPSEQLLEGATMTGTLVTIKDEGYGFIWIGQGMRQVFVRVTDAPAHLWRKGAKLRFTVHPPKKGRSWVAQDVEDANLPSSDDLDRDAEEKQARGATGAS